MSHVADTVVWTMLDEDAAMRPVQEWLDANGYGQLVEVAENAGGHKAFQGQLWIGAFNYLNIRDFLGVVFAQAFEFPDNVAVTIEDEHWEGPRLFRKADDYGGKV